MIDMAPANGAATLDDVSIATIVDGPISLTLLFRCNDAGAEARRAGVGWLRQAHLRATSP